LYGMEFTQIIHPSGSIKRMNGLTKGLFGQIRSLNRENRQFKNPFHDYALSDGAKSDRLLEGKKVLVHLQGLLQDQLLNRLEIMQEN